MTHYSERLPLEVEQGAVRRLSFATDVVKTDGGGEVRNARWSVPLRTYELSFPTAHRNNTVYQRVLYLYNLTLGGLHSFDMAEWTDNTHSTIVKVRFDSSLAITGIDRNLDHIETLTLVEVRT